MNPLKIGTIAAVAAVAMVLTELVWQPVFTVRFSDSFALPLWILVAVYAGLQFALWHFTRKGMSLSDDEIARWGPTLERVTPDVLRRCEERTSVKEIAADLERDEGIPRDVTLRYIIALGRHLEGGGA